MTPKELVEIQGYAFLPSYRPHSDPNAVAAMFGVPELVDGLRLVQELVPTPLELTTPNTYSGNFGLGGFPFHTDLAHWARPPRYLMLRCAIGDPDTYTELIDGFSLVAAIGSNTLTRCLARPRRPIKGALQLLPVWQPVSEAHPELLRWDSVYLQPTNEYAHSVFKQITGWLLDAQSKRHVLLNEGDTLLLDNWRVLHGRSAVPDPDSSRKIQRLYLSSLT